MALRCSACIVACVMVSRLLGSPSLARRTSYILIRIIAPVEVCSAATPGESLAIAPIGAQSDFHTSPMATAHDPLAMLEDGSHDSDSAERSAVMTQTF